MSTNDLDRHPYLQGYEPAGVFRGEYCGRMNRLNGVCAQPAEASVHEVVDFPSDITVVMETPVAEPPFPAGRVYGAGAPDAPGEDDQFQHDGDADGTHNLFSCRHPECVADAERARVETAYAPASFGAQTAVELENGGEVTTGPWPVRQYRYDDASGQEACAALVRALSAAGEAFYFEVWWANAAVRMARVQWGAFLGLSGIDMIAQVAAWPPAG